jgi:hypothetical protein
MTVEQVAQFLDRIENCGSIRELATMSREMQPLMSKEPISTVSKEQAAELRLLQAVYGRASFLIEQTEKAAPS